MSDNLVWAFGRVAREFVGGVNRLGLVFVTRTGVLFVHNAFAFCGCLTSRGCFRVVRTCLLLFMDEPCGCVCGFVWTFGILFWLAT